MKNNEIDQFLKDSNGKYYLLKISILTEEYSAEEFVPDEPDFPNACRYTILSEIDKDGTREAILMHDVTKKEVVVRKLKEIHDISDPWDTEPDVYAEKWRKAHEARPKLSEEELEKARAKALAEAIEEENLRKRE